ncbi:MAG: hypothetical protein RLZZ505_783 [Verrucomicrobiota bacterium]|jgi:hypothetical protein
MNKKPLIFDWTQSEASRKDQFFSVMIVGLLFASVVGMIELSLPSHQSDSMAQGTLIRLVDGDMAKFWTLVAEENGPFPGRRESDGEDMGLVFEKEQGLAWWTDYEVRLRPMHEEAIVARVEITPKGKREFPKMTKSAADTRGKSSRAVSLLSEPTLVPYDAAALEWLPDALPGFDLPAIERTTDSLRFLVSLREDGSVAELIPLAGAADPAQEGLANWLRGIRFKKGKGERWFGLRIDFVNRRGNESEPE